MSLLPILNPQILWNLRRVIHPVIKSSDNVYLLSRYDGVSHGKTQWTFFPTRFMSHVSNRDWSNEDDHACEVWGVCVRGCVWITELGKIWGRGEESQSGYVLQKKISTLIWCWGKVYLARVGVGGVVWCRVNRPRHENTRPGIWVRSATLESHFSSLWGGLSFLICKNSQLDKGFMKTFGLWEPAVSRRSQWLSHGSPLSHHSLAQRWKTSTPGACERGESWEGWRERENGYNTMSTGWLSCEKP